MNPALLPKGRRRSALERAFDCVLAEDLTNRVLVFDETAVATAAQLPADRQRAGRVVDLRDTLIAGIAQAVRATIATRNTRHFEGFDVPIFDPWHAYAAGPHPRRRPVTSRRANQVEETGNNLGTVTPKHRGNGGVGPTRKQDELTRWDVPALSAKPPPPVQIRAAPPILNSFDTVTCGRSAFERLRQFETIRVGGES